jgi:Alkylmercury lyase
VAELQTVTTCDPAWAAAGTAARHAGLPRELRRLHQAILAFFLDTGGPPARLWLHERAAELALDPQTAYAELARADLVRLDETGQVLVAYPFSGVPSGHSVQLVSGPPVWAMCAIDALGIPQMTRRDGTIRATDPDSGDPVRVAVTGSEWRWRPQSATVLAAGGGAGDPNALCCCPHVNFFTSPDHAAAYLASHPGLTGQLLAQRTAIELAGVVFGALLGAD